MSDITEGQDAPSDDALFRDAIDAPTLEKFDNPAPPAEPKPAEPKPEAKGPEADKGKEPQEAIPAFRLREESDARRRVEAERDELRRRIEAMERPAPRQQQQPPPRVDFFDNPTGFVRQEVEPLMRHFADQLQQTREGMSLNFAITQHGEETVRAARAALEQSLRMGDPGAHSAYQRAMEGHDPYGVITRWHRERETIGAVGSDLNAYKQRVLDEAMKDPEFQKRVIEATRGAALANGQTVHRPAQSKVSTAPSLANFGAGGGDETASEPSDEQLFRQAVTAKRR